MRKVIIFLVLIIIAGKALACDPNSLPAAKDWRVSVNNAGIMTIDVRLSPEQLKVYADGGVKAIEVVRVIVQSLRSQVSQHWQNWLKTKKWQDRK